MLFRQFKSIFQAFYALFADSGFAMAGAVAYSFVLSFFPFCIFLGAHGRLLRRRAAGQAGDRAAVRAGARPPWPRPSRPR